MNVYYEILKNMRKIKTYEVLTDDSKVFAISLVEHPAIESNFIYLHKEEPKQVFLEKDEKHMLYGAVLIPDFPIYRYQSGEEYYITFPSATIEKLAHSYLQNDNIYSFTKDHNSIADGVSVVESWIKASKNDKSVDLGLDVPDGTWLIGAKIENEELWESIKKGDVKGFSVESFVQLEEINLSKDMTKENNMEAVEITDGFWDKLKAIIADALGKTEEEVAEVEMAEVKPVEEEVAEEVPVEAEVEMAEELPAEEEVPVEVTPEEIAEEVIAVVEETATDEAAKIKELEDIINVLEKDLADRDAEIENLKSENTKLSKQPSGNIIKVEASKNEGGYSFMDFASGKMKIK